MVDFLRRAVLDLEAPLCPNCNIEMTWFRSMRMSMEPNVIVHVFQCSQCALLREVKTFKKDRQNGKPKHGARSRSAAA
jgi:hypothetical protein